MYLHTGDHASELESSVRSSPTMVPSTIPRALCVRACWRAPANFFGDHIAFCPHRIFCCCWLVSKKHLVLCASGCRSQLMSIFDPHGRMLATDGLDHVIWPSTVRELNVRSWSLW